MHTTTKKEVSCKPVISIINAAKKKNIDTEKILEGIPYDLSYLLNKNERVEWWVWCKIISNLRQFIKYSDYIVIGRDYVNKQHYIEGYLFHFMFFSAAVMAKISKGLLLKSGKSIINPMFTCVTGNWEFIEKNKFRLIMNIDKGYEPCPEWFYMSLGVMEELRSKVGVNSYRYDNLVIGSSSGSLEISMIKEGFFTRVKKLVYWLFNIKKAFNDLTESHEALLNNYNKLDESQRLLQKQTTQLKTAYQIAKSIRHSLDLTTTINGITDELVNDTGFTSARIILFKDIEGNKLEIEASNSIKEEKSTPIQHPIVIEGEKIGELVLYPDIDQNIIELDELLDYLLPIINISIHDSLVLRTVTDYKNNLETRVDERTTELKKAQDKLSEVIQLQNRFFTNISHEFRTPLTLILGPSKQILDKIDDISIRGELELINRNAKKLNRLANQLLDISKIEAGRMRFITSKQDLIPIVKRIISIFKSFAERKSISLSFNAEEQSIILYLDEEKIDKILSNILSNALKFTPSGGCVIINVSKDNKLAEISVSDSGIGIPSEQLSKIFDRFYQVDNRLSKEYEGTGIGLSLTKELVELHKGKIEVESDEGKGTTFRISLPLGKEHLKPEEIGELFKDTGANSASLDIMSLEELKTNNFGVEYDYKSDPPNINVVKPVLLLIEDSSDVRKYIKDILKDDYRIAEAADGGDGWNKSIENLPELIVSDIMMPGLDGLQLCERLKTDERTSHIPVILLTAKAAVNDKLNGLETGADDYIIKPFEPKELKVRIKNLIEQRKRIHEYFQRKGLFELNQTEITSIDKRILQKTFDIINSNISNFSFNVETLADNLNMSRFVLYRKVISLTGESPVELIRRIRLLKAANLIENNFGNLSEIALEVGFNNPAYFSECFKKQFGIPPSQYLQKIINK